MTPKKECAPRRPRGRPPSFDRDIALSQAMTLFWDRGYEGTSFDDLIGVMGISASSFYNSFASKEALYVEAIEAYARRESAWFTQALGSDGGVALAFRTMLDAAALAFTRCDAPSGCMIAVAATQCSPAQARLRQMVIDQRHAAEALMEARLAQAAATGELSENVDCAALAAYFSAVINGMGVQARDGASRDRLLQIGALAVSVLGGNALSGQLSS
ncbi:TetR/AcrR family transcriptional regulator [Asaia sp. VD9]|uniref:TetR/AcrR family transcriptional regulator n=1 Tax=Asaia sp. VD9 TaxID=3081235 RepID=UPI003019F488